MNDTAKRFRIAFSFSGEKRDFIAKVATILAARFSKEEILYDKYHEAEFARKDLGFYLPRLYHNQSDLIVVVLCRDYPQKEWCGLEWDAIFALLKKGKCSEVTLCRFDHATIQGLWDTEGFVELDDKTPHQAAARILERLALNEGKGIDYYHSNATRPYVQSSFIGRTRELLEIEKLILDHYLLTLTDPGGCRKTRLALEAADRLWPQFSDG